MNRLLEISLRFAVISDLEELMELETHCFDPEVSFSRRQIRRHIVNGCIIVALDKEGRIVAQTTVLKRRQSSSQVSVRLYSLAVSPLMRGKGIARKILSEALLRFVDKHTVLVSVEVEVGNPAETLYRSMGFKEKKLLTDYYGKNRHGLRMVLGRPQNSGSL